MYKKTTFHIIALVCTAILVYFPILGNDFLYYWDDQWMVMNHYTEGGFNFQNLWAILVEYYHGQYGPVNEYMYLFLYTLFGYEPLVFHIASLLLHIGCVCFVYIVIKRIFSQTTRTVNKEQAPLIAFFTTFLFTIHPMNVESVAWISAVKILNYAFYYLIATYTFMLYLDKKKIRYYIFTLLLFTLSFGGKEQAVTFPVWLLLLYWLLGYSFKDRKVWIQVAPFFLLAIVFGFVTMFSQAVRGSGVLGNEISYPMWQRFLLGSYSLFEYLAKFLFPYKQLYIYPFPIVIGEPLPTWMLFYPALIVVIMVTLWKYISKWPVAVGLIFFFIHIAITLHIIPLSRFAIIADRYIYISSTGLSFIFAYYFVWITQTKRSLFKNGIIVLFTIYALWLGISANRRCYDWKDSKAIRKELRELIQQRDDYVPEEDEELINEYK